MGAPQLTLATESLTGSPLRTAQLVVLPTDDWTTIPAYLNWGNWNGCPAPEYHIAALRPWRDRFGAELIGLSHDVMNRNRSQSSARFPIGWSLDTSAARGKIMTSGGPVC
jgi:hypothetical protein